MALTKGALNVLFVLQKIVPPPYQIEKVTLTLSKNPSRLSPWQTRIRITMVTSILNLTIVSFFYLLWLFHLPESKVEIVEKYVYMVVLSLCTIAFSAYCTMEIHQKEIMYLLQQRFKLVNVRSSAGQKLREKSVQELFIYCFGTIFAAFPLAVFFYPFTLNFHPVHVIFSILVDSPSASISIQFLVKFIASIVYSTTTFYGAGICLSIMLFAVIDLEGVQLYCKKLYVSDYRPHRKNIDNHPNCFTEEACCGNLKFRSCLKRFRITQIMIAISNGIMHTFLGILTSMGILLGVGCAYGTIKMYDSLPITTYLSCPVIVSVCILYDFLHVTLASIPNKQGEMFVVFWKQFTYRRRERRELRACPIIGYAIGPMRRVKMSTALAIADCIFNWAASTALVKESSKLDFAPVTIIRF
ncbi:unnamed protein product [Orchesella dallaii]|uniref:Odorant receptor n=1 Tax=Orchesella dallaii TaxID=48710 RepID=A0ABP1RV72_9HEXA